MYSESKQEAFKRILGGSASYKKQLKTSREARSFLSRRGFKSITNLSHKFHVGCSDNDLTDYFYGYITFPVYRRKRLKHMTGRWFMKQEDDTVKHKHLFGQINHFYNHDVIFESDYVIIVESPLCCLSLQTYGFPAVAAFGQGKIPSAASDISKDQDIFIINDTDLNGAGLRGAYKQAYELWNYNRKIRIGRLPLPRGKTKIDINDVFRKENRYVFEQVINRTIKEAGKFIPRRRKKDYNKYSGSNKWRNQYDIVEVLKSYVVDLDFYGSNYIGYCPIHGDVHTKSLVVYPESQSYYCFGACNDGGDVAKFLMLYLNLGFLEAREYLKKNHK